MCKRDREKERGRKEEGRRNICEKREKVVISGLWA